MHRIIDISINVNIKEMADSHSGSYGPPPSPEYLAEDYGHVLIAVCSVMLALQVVAVGARFYARRILKSPFGLDDYLIIPALVCCSFWSSSVVSSASPS